MNEHTPGTWYAHDTTTQDNRPVWYSEVRVAAGPSAYQTVALCRSVGYQRQDAQYIARTCNAHEALVEALESFMADNGHSIGCGWWPGMEHLGCIPRCITARAALALARGEGARE